MNRSSHCRRLPGFLACIALALAVLPGCNSGETSKPGSITIGGDKNAAIEPDFGGDKSADDKPKKGQPAVKSVKDRGM